MKRTTLIFPLLLLASLSLFSSCKKTGGSNNVDDGGEIHIVDQKLVGTWMWTKGSDGAYYDDNGVYSGAANGLAIEFKINADGTGTCFNHFFSSIGTGTDFEINISSKGFFETDDQGHLGYFPVSGTYKTSNGTNRPLAGGELWDVKNKKGNNMLFQKLIVTTQGNRACFQVTSSDGLTDTFFKIN